MESAWRSAIGHSRDFRPRSTSTASSLPRAAACSCPVVPRGHRGSAAARAAGLPRVTRSTARGFQSTEENLDLLLRLEIPGPRRHLEPLPVGSQGLVASSPPLQRPAEAAVGCRVVWLEPYRLPVLDDGALGLPCLEVGARQTEPDDRIIRHQLGHLLELGDPVALGHQFKVGGSDAAPPPTPPPASREMKSSCALS